MDRGQDILSEYNEAWTKLNLQWNDENSKKAFYRKYTEKMIEVIENFETTCSKLNEEATELLKELQTLENNID